MKILLCIAFVFCFALASGGERVVFADGNVSLEVPDGWIKSELNQGATLVGWETQDKTTSVFFQEMNSNAGSMEEMMDNIIENFDQSESLSFQKIGAYKSGQVNGTGRKCPAVYATLDVTFKTGEKDFEMKYYLFVFDTGSVQYLMQASSTKPVRGVREKQIMDLIRSLLVKSD